MTARSEQPEIIVIGGGQAGLALGYLASAAQTPLRHSGPRGESSSPMVVKLLAPEWIEPGARLLASGMRDNPLHRRIFGSDEARIEPLLATAFARLLQRQMRTGLVLGAFAPEQTLVGLAAMVPPGHCQPTLQDKLGMLAILAGGRMLRHLPKIQRWLRIWVRQDPDSDHWHLGPAAVKRELQGQGIGTLLMTAICDHLDQLQVDGYLETDKHRNVRLYGRGGFEVVAELPVLGVTNWFMLRHPRIRTRDSISAARTRCNARQEGDCI